MYWRSDLDIPERPYEYSGAKHKAHGTLIHDVRELYRLEQHLRGVGDAPETSLGMLSPEKCWRMADSLRRFLTADYPEPVGRPDVSGRNGEIAVAYWALVWGAGEKQVIASRAISERLKAIGLPRKPVSISRIAQEAIKDADAGKSGHRARALRRRLIYERREVARVARPARWIGRRDAYWFVAAWALSIVAEDLALALDWERHKPVPQPESAPKP